MKIHDIGGEFALIRHLSEKAPTSHSDLTMGIGDDAAVIAGCFPNGDSLLVTTDMLMEGSHFRCDWSSAFQIGIKSAICNLSDIAAMGGWPTFIFVSISLPPDTEVSWVQDLYDGIFDASRRYDVVLAGGDTTHGDRITISITLLGRVSPGQLCLRSQARPGDLLCVTGHLGGAAAGLAMLMKGMDVPAYLLKKHRTPQCRLDVSPTIATVAHAMIDISDGLAAEVLHICEQSRTGAEVIAADIPIHPHVEEAARHTGRDPMDFALTGGEDFELLFSLPPEKLPFLKEKGIQVVVVGCITEADAGRDLVLSDGNRRALSGGYNHFQ